MTSALRTDFLRDLLLKKLRDNKEFPKQLSTAVHPLQILKVCRFLLNSSNPSLLVIASLMRLTSLCSLWSLTNSPRYCVNSPPNVATNLKGILVYPTVLIGRLQDRRFSQITGGLVYPLDWQFKVFKLPSSGEFKAAIEINRLRYMG